jgi:hypothetical protein
MHTQQAVMKKLSAENHSSAFIIVTFSDFTYITESPTVFQTCWGGGGGGTPEDPSNAFSDGHNPQLQLIDHSQRSQLS